MACAQTVDGNNLSLSLRSTEIGAPPPRTEQIPLDAAKVTLHASTGSLVIEVDGAQANGVRGYLIAAKANGHNRAAFELRCEGVYRDPRAPESIKTEVTVSKGAINAAERLTCIALRVTSLTFCLLFLHAHKQTTTPGSTVARHSESAAKTSQLKTSRCVQSELCTVHCAFR